MNAGILRLLWRNLMKNYKIDNKEEESALCGTASGAGRDMKDSMDGTGIEVLRSEALTSSGSNLAAAVQEALSALGVDGTAASEKHDGADRNKFDEMLSFLQERVKAGKSQSDSGRDQKAAVEDAWRWAQQKDEKPFSNEDAYRKILEAGTRRITEQGDGKMTSSYDGREILENFKKWVAEPFGRDMSVPQDSNDAPEMTAHDWASRIIKQAGKHYTD